MSIFNRKKKPKVLNVELKMLKMPSFQVHTCRACGRSLPLADAHPADGWFWCQTHLPRAKRSN